MLYQILEKTPFSAQYFPSEPFRPISEFQLQEAEYNLKLNKKHYYEHAVKVGDRFWYPREIAERIAEYWRKKWSFAEYQLTDVESTPNTGLQSDGALCSCLHPGQLTEDFICQKCGLPFLRPAAKANR
jgi:hypothetical protein